MTQTLNGSHSSVGHAVERDRIEPQPPPDSQTISGFDPEPFDALRIYAETFFDAQEFRKATANRIRSQTIDAYHYAELADTTIVTERWIRKAMIGQYRQIVDTQLPGVAAWQKATSGIGEHLLARLLGHLGHPRIAFPAHWEGTGSKRRLVNDQPYWRTVRQLWAYCGHGDPARRRRKGMSAEEAFELGSPTLKMLVWNLASAAMKTKPGDAAQARSDSHRVGGGVSDLSTLTHGECDSHSRSGEGYYGDAAHNKGDSQLVAGGVSDPSTLTHETADSQWPDGEGDSPVHPTPKPRPSNHMCVGWVYRTVYDQRRAQTAERQHATPCVRCGPSGHPAAEGTAWSAAHQHADALRIVGKTILKDLWTAAEPEQKR